MSDRAASYVASSSRIATSEVDSVTTSVDINEPEDIIHNLTTQLNKLHRVYESQMNTFANNASEPVNRDVEDDDWPLKEMTKFGHCLLQEVNQVEPTYIPKDKTHVLFDLADSLNTQMHEMLEIIDKSKKEIEATKEENTLITSRIEQLKKTEQSRQVRGEMKMDAELEKKCKIVSKEFKKHRSWLNKMVEELFEDRSDNLKDLLAELLSAFFSEEDDYIDVANNVSYHPFLAMMQDASIIRAHPYDKNKIKICDFK